MAQWSTLAGRIFFLSRRKKFVRSLHGVKTEVVRTLLAIYGHVLVCVRMLLSNRLTPFVRLSYRLGILNICILFAFDLGLVVQTVMDGSADTVTGDALAEGLIGLLKPAVEEVDERVRNVR